MPQNDPFLAAGQSQPPFFAGIDLGGTNIKVGVVDDLGRPLAKLSIPTESAKGPEDAARRMARAVLDVVGKAGLAPAAIARVGLGSPGTMDIPAGRLVNPVNLKGWDDFPLRDRVAEHCRRPVTFQNDANAAAYGEFWVGSGRDFHSMVLFTLGTGIGCGIIVGDLSIDGENSHGAECGHTIIDCSAGARLCGCGQPGHLEAYASATAVVKRVREALDAGRPSSLRQRIAENRHLTPKLLANEAAAGDALSLEIVAETARYLGVGIVESDAHDRPERRFAGRGDDLRRPRERLGPAVFGLDPGGSCASRVSCARATDDDRFRFAGRRRRLHRRRRHGPAGTPKAFAFALNICRRPFDRWIGELKY